MATDENEEKHDTAATESHTNVHHAYCGENENEGSSDTEYWPESVLKDYFTKIAENVKKRSGRRGYGLKTRI